MISANSVMIHADARHRLDRDMKARRRKSVAIEPCFAQTAGAVRGRGLRTRDDGAPLVARGNCGSSSPICNTRRAISSCMAGSRPRAASTVHSSNSFMCKGYLLGGRRKPKTALADRWSLRPAASIFISGKRNTC